MKKLETIKFVVDNSKYVTINSSKINDIIPIIKDFKSKNIIDEYIEISHFSLENKALFLLIYESLDFCFWSKDKKWKIEYNWKLYSGAYWLYYTLIKVIDNNKKQLDIDYLIENLREILTSTIEIPLFEERLQILKQLKKEIKKTWNVLNLFLWCKSGDELLNIIIENFKNFRDISIYENKEIFFLKRTTLLVNDLYNNIPQIKQNIQNIDSLYWCADYKIPQVLRYYWILEYKAELEKIIDNEIELEHDSIMGIEIRANMIYAIELIKEKMNNKLNSIEINNILWLLSKEKDFKSKSYPYHLTRTIYY